MKSKQILFFATMADIEPLIKSIETTFSIKYYEMGMFELKTDTFFTSVSEIPDFGTPKSGDWNKDMRLMAIPQAINMMVREIPQRSGCTKYAIDTIENHISICFQFGGVFKNGILVAGNCFITNPDSFALEIFKNFTTKIKKEFKKIGSFYVGKKAEEKLKIGWRLVTNEKSPKEYDLMADNMQKNS